MRTKFHHNFTLDALVEQVKEVLCCDYAETVSFKLVYAKDSVGKWTFFIGSCTIGDADKYARYVYEDFAFVRETYTNFSVRDLLSCLDRIGEDLGSEYQPLGVPSNLPCTESIIPSFLSKGKFPFRQFAISFSNARGHYDLGVPLVGYDLPYRTSARFYVREFLDLSRYHGESDGQNGSLLVYVEDPRGRIILNADSLQVESEYEDLMLIGQLSSAEPLSLKVGEAHFSNCLDTESTDLWLIDRNNKLIDFFSASHTYVDFLGRSSISEAYIKLVEGGENHTCEFKSYIDLISKNNTKAEQIERTVCAFSNAVGGKLLIGISDDGVIEGVDKRVKEDYRTSVDEAVIQYIKAIRKRLNEKLRDGKCVEVKAVEIRGMNIVAVDTARSKEVNYYLGSRLGFVRKGATSVKMTAADNREPINGHGFI